MNKHLKRYKKYTKKKKKYEQKARLELSKFIEDRRS